MYRFPSRMLDMLASFEDPDIERVAQEWAAYWQAHGWLGFQKDAAANREVLVGLSGLAKQAKAAGKTILIRDAGAY